MKNLTLGFCPKFFLGVTINVEKSGKIQVDEKFFRVYQGKKEFKNLKKIYVFLGLVIPANFAKLL